MIHEPEIHNAVAAALRAALPGYTVADYGSNPEPSPRPAAITILENDLVEPPFDIQQTELSLAFKVPSGTDLQALENTVVRAVSGITAWTLHSGKLTGSLSDVSGKNNTVEHRLSFTLYIS